MPKKKNADDSNQPLLPLPGVERVEPSGTISLAKLKAAEPVKTATAASSTPEPSTPIIPRSTDASSGSRRREWHVVWHGLRRGGRMRFWSSDGRSWSEHTAWDTARHAIVHYSIPATLSLVALISSCSGGKEQATQEGWTPVIQRAP